MLRVRRLAGNGMKFRPFHLQGGDRIAQSPRIGMFRVVKQIVGPRALHDPACIHDHDPIAKAGDNAKIMADQYHRHPQLTLHLLNQLQNLRLNGHVQRRGRFVGNKKVRLGDEGHCDHDPLPHASGEFVRVHFQAMFRLGNTGFIQHGQRAIRGGGARDLFMDHQWLPNAQEWIERRHRVLENHGNSPAPNAVKFAAGTRQQIDTAEKGAPAFDASRRLRHQAHDGITSHGFAGA